MGAGEAAERQRWKQGMVRMLLLLSRQEVTGAGPRLVDSGYGEKT